MTVSKLNRYMYQSLVMAIWLAGCYFIIKLVELGVTRPDLFKLEMGAGIIVGLVFAAAISLYSFWLGGHPGHILRATNVFLFMILSYLIFSDYAFNDDVSLLISARTWACGIAIVLVNMNWGKRMKEEYKANGKVDYFDVYFGEN